MFSTHLLRGWMFSGGSGFKFCTTEWQQEQLQKGVQLSPCCLLVGFDCSVLSLAQLSSQIHGTQESVSVYKANKSVKNFIVQK